MIRDGWMMADAGRCLLPFTRSLLSFDPVPLRAMPHNIKFSAKVHPLKPAHPGHGKSMQNSPKRKFLSQDRVCCSKSLMAGSLGVEQEIRDLRGRVKFAIKQIAQRAPSDRWCGEEADSHATKSYDICLGPPALPAGDLQLFGKSIKNLLNLDLSRKERARDAYCTQADIYSAKEETNCLDSTRDQ